jgi:uncharacterized protein (DUF2336 family)
MSDTVPSGGETGGAARLLASARERLAVALADLALPAPLRLTEWQRRTVSALLAGLIRAVEEELRTEIAGHFGGDGGEAVHAALTSAHVPIAEPILERSFALGDATLIGALLRRAEEHRLHRAANAESALLIELAGDGDEDIAAEAMALLIAQGGRLDRFQEPVMARTELGAELQHRLVWAVAAALRAYLTGPQGVPAPVADRAIAAAAGRLLAGYDEGGTVEAMALRLVRRLDHAARLDDALTARTLAEGSLPLFLAALAVRTGLDHASVWEIVSDPAGRGAAILLRAAGIGRNEAASILLALDGEQAEARIGLYDALGEAEATSELALWHADPGYREAIARLAS